MIRFLHIVAIAALVVSAVYVYSVKYDTILLAERVAKLKNQVQREKDSIAVLKAEWQRLNRPERVQALADTHLDLQPLSVLNIARFDELPQRQPKTDEIGRKLETLGLSMPTSTPREAWAADARTPSSSRSR
jgi:cell division protein FtsL